MHTVKQIKRTYYLVTFLFWLAVALPLALAVLIAQARGLNLFQVGVVMGLYSFTIVLLEVPTGGLADAIGRKRVTLLAYGFALLTGVVWLLAFSFWTFVLAFVFNGVSRALASGALDAWFVDALQTADPDIDIQPPLAQAGTVTLLALGLGTLLGGIIPQLFSALPAAGTAVFTPFSMTIVFAIGVKIVLIAAVVLLVKEERPSGSSGDWRQGYRQLPRIVGDAFTLSRRNPTVLLLLGATLVAGLALSGIETFWQPRFAALLGGSEEHSLFFGAAMAGSFLAGMVGNMVSIPLSRLLKKRYALVAALFQGGQGVMLVVLALQTTVPAALLLFWLVYLNLGALNSPHATLFNRQIPAARRSSMLSVQSLATYVGTFTGSTVLGYLAENYTISTAWIVAGIALMVSLFLYLSVDNHQTTLEEVDEQKAPLLETR